MHEAGKKKLFYPSRFCIFGEFFFLFNFAKIMIFNSKVRTKFIIICIYNNSSSISHTEPTVE